MMAEVYVSKELGSLGLIQFWDKEPQRIPDKWGIGFRGGRLVSELHVDQYAAKVIIKGLNLRPGQCKPVKLVEVKDDG